MCNNSETVALPDLHLFDQLRNFFMWFRSNGEKYEGKSIEHMIAVYLKEAKAYANARRATATHPEMWHTVPDNINETSKNA
jgi:hypothetical protein